MSEPYKFKRVEEFFGSKREYVQWDSLAKEAALPDTKLSISSWRDPTSPFKNEDFIITVQVGRYSLSIVMLSFNCFRVQFHPANPNGKYPLMNSRAIVCDDLIELRDYLNSRPNKEKYMFKVQHKEEPNLVHTFTTEDEDRGFGRGFLAVEVDLNKESFGVVVKQRVSVNGGKSQDVVVFRGIDWYFCPNGFSNDFEVIFAAHKPVAAKYLGFGEQGGRNISKNQSQLTYFNYDNMRYKQVYNEGPCDAREPLYHSDPFFIELNGTQHETMWGVYIDNPSQILVDVGYLDTSTLAFGTRFGGLDFYFILGKDVSMLTRAFTAIIGRPKLKPRYVLGYHQGCYGYDTREKVLQAARDHRHHGMPLDGIHIDVDMQYGYRTFSIASNDNFTNPEGMFTELRDLGIKCSTNITPVVSSMGRNTRSSQGGKTGYSTYDSGIEGQMFVKEQRDWYSVESGYAYQDFSSPPANVDRKTVQDHEYYVGEVYYGDNADGTPRGTEGHYPNLYDPEVRLWWGRQYEYLLRTGLEFVWQDMTTPAIRSTKGDYKSFPMRLLVRPDWLRLKDTDDQKYESVSLYNTRKEEPILRVWNLYSYNLHKATYHGLNMLNQEIPGREFKRTFIVGRGSFSGMHRYAGLWTGDNASTWQFFRINVAQAMALGICGMSINGQDIGGFETSDDGGKWCDPQLLIRWTLAGSFLPWFRNHYQAKNDVKYFQEPYRYPRSDEDLRRFQVPEAQWGIYRAVLPACKHFIMLRYRLLQVFYDAMFHNMFDGIPVVRALLLNEPHDRSLYNDNLDRLSDQLFVGGDLLIAPIMFPDEDKNPDHQRRIYLPSSSNWYQFMDNRHPLLPPEHGGTTIRNYDAHISDDPNHIPFMVPMFVRSGAIIPMLEPENYIGEHNRNKEAYPITFNIYPGHRSRTIQNEGFRKFLKDFYGRDFGHKFSGVDGLYNLYLDNGETLHGAPEKCRQFKTDPYIAKIPEEQRSQYRHTVITHKLDKAVRTIDFVRVWDKYTPPFEPYFFVAILHDPSERSAPIETITIAKHTRDPSKESASTDAIQFNSIPEFGHIDVESRATAVNSSTTDAWYYNNNLHASFIKVHDNHHEITIKAVMHSS